MKSKYALLAISGWTMLACSSEDPPPPVNGACSLEYSLPVDAAAQTQAAFDALSWRTFLSINATAVNAAIGAGDDVPQWRAWSSTDDIIECLRNPSRCEGERYYPAACQAVSGHAAYRVLEQHAKVDDSFLEAMRGGLSNNPVIDTEGNFVRYEILVSPSMRDFVGTQQLYQKAKLCALTSSTGPVSFPCGTAGYTGGNPASSDMGPIVVKLAWMELGSRDASSFHTEDLLVFSPGYRRFDPNTPNNHGLDACELKKMALVGMHVVRKTPTQPAWVWATFEHQDNAPDCSGLPPAGTMSQPGPGPNKGCPAQGGYNFFPDDCSNDRCAMCNSAPTSNLPSTATSSTACKNTALAATQTAWCIGTEPAAMGGYSRLCRQVPLQTGYPEAYAQTQACQSALTTAGSVWARYSLISTQWLAASNPGCGNISATAKKDDIQPKVTLPNGMRSYLANTSMESYERSDCMGCHQTASVAMRPGCAGGRSTDFAYWLQLEVAK